MKRSQSDSRIVLKEADMPLSPSPDTAPSPTNKNMALFYNIMGINYHEGKNLTAAIGYFQKASDLQPSNKEYNKNLAQAHYFLGVGFARLSHLIKAIKHISKAIELDSDCMLYKTYFAEFNNSIALSFHGKSKYFNALTYFKAAHDLQPLNKIYIHNLVYTHYDIATNLYNRKNYAKALEHYAQASLLQPNDSSHLINIGRAHYGMGEQLYNSKMDEMASKHFIEALKFFPKNIHYFSKLIKIHKVVGDYFFNLKEYEKSVYYFKQANALTHKFPTMFLADTNFNKFLLDIQKNLALTLFAIKPQREHHVNDAACAWEAVVNMEPSSANILYLIYAHMEAGNLYILLKGDHSKAETHYRECIKILNLNSESPLWWFDYAVSIAEYAKAPIRFYHFPSTLKTVTGFDFQTLLNDLLNFSLHHGEWMATNYLDFYKKLEISSYNSLRALAKIELERLEIVESENKLYLRKQHEALGKVYCKLSKYENALSKELYHHKASDHFKKSGTFFSIAKIFEKKLLSVGNKIESKSDYYKLSLGINNDDPITHLDLSESYEKEGNSLLAVFHYQKAIKYFPKLHKAITESLPGNQEGIQSMNSPPIINIILGYYADHIDNSGYYYSSEARQEALGLVEIEQDVAGQLG